MPATAKPPATESLAVLKALAELGAGKDWVLTTSGALAERLGVSQQTASRRVLELLDEGLLQRREAPKAQRLRITAKGLELLRREFEQLRAILEEAKPGALAITGKVAAGLGEGGWYISRRGYQVALEKLLGFLPYYGTLNLALEGPEADKLQELGARDGLLVPEFQDEGRTFGAVKVFPATLRGVSAGVVIPLRGHHRDVLEAVAPVHLRTELRLKDGDDVRIDVRFP